jgi:hypothetical protein
LIRDKIKRKRIGYPRLVVISLGFFVIGRRLTQPINHQFSSHLLE